jgi:RNA binding exosome subunit
LPSKVPITHIDIRVLVHATEDEDKVLSAVRNTLPTKMSGDITFRRTSLTGHHGNPITLFEAKIKDKGQIKAFFENFASKLGSLDKEILNSEIERHLDRGCLYVRLNKQSAYLNEIKLCTTDPIHFRIHFKKSNFKEILEICRNFGIIP